MKKNLYKAFNTVTGLYYSIASKSFNHTSDEATHLDEQQLAVVRFCFDNVAASKV